MQVGNEEPSAYPVLAALLGGDGCKIRRILRVFHQSVGKDLRRMELAASEGNWSRVTRLMHRIAIGCRQIGEENIADVLTSDVLAAIEHARYSAGSIAFAQSLRSARHELIEVLERAAAYAAADDPDSGSEGPAF